MDRKVIDFYTRRDWSELGKQDTAANDLIAAREGKYVGLLPKPQADTIRDHVADMERQRTQIERMMQDFKVKWDGYFYMTVAALSTTGFGMTEFDAERQELYVDKNGHCWLVNTQDKED